MTTNQAAQIDRLITQRARHFAAGDKHGAWLFAADVACCVEPNLGEGGRNLTGAPRASDNGKVSARTFADRAGIGSHDRVLRYLKVWDAAAAHDPPLVPPSSTLNPRSEPELPNDTPSRDDANPTTWEYWWRSVFPITRQSQEPEPSTDSGPSGASRDTSDIDGEPLPPEPPSGLRRLIEELDIGLAMSTIRAKSEWTYRQLAERSDRLTDEDRDDFAEWCGDVRLWLDAIMSVLGRGEIDDEALRRITGDGGAE
jgi:hypothetical protein